jgi:hypothetical protein
MELKPHPPYPGNTLAMRNRLGPYLLLAALGLAFFSPLMLHPTETLYCDHSDLLALHLPLKRFLVRSWQETGEVPLWNPYSFAGNPFIHDVQVAAFYPPHFLLYMLRPESLGAALSWLVVLHVIAAGWCMHAYARWQGLGTSGALVAGVGYMFAGKWLLHILLAGHYIMVPLTWLPLVVLWLEQALRQRSLIRAAWAGAAFALIILGTHPQVTFYAGLFVALWSLGPALERSDTAKSQHPWRRMGWGLCRWLGYGSLLLLTAVTIGAVQLLPALEAAPLTTRGVVGIADYRLSGTIASVCGLAGPRLTGPSWERRAGLGVVWLAAGVLAPFLRGGRVRFQAGVCLLLLFMALGGASLLQGLIGFRVFRLPSRVFFVLALPVALLAGVTTQALFDGTEPASCGSHRRRAIVLVVGALVLLAVALDALLSRMRGHTLEWHAYWLVLPLTLGLAFWLVGKPMDGVHGWRRPIWGGLLLADLWLLAWPALDVRPLEKIYAPSSCVRELEAACNEDRSSGGRRPVRVLDQDPPGQPGDTPLGPALPVLRGIEPVRGYNSFDVHDYKAYIQFISNESGPPDPHEWMSTFDLKNQALLDLLGAEYLIQPSSRPIDTKHWRKVSTDRDPHAYCYISGGVRLLPPYSLYRNLDTLPRAFLVPEAVALTDRSNALGALKATDFRQTVLLEGWTPEPEADRITLQIYRPAVIKEYSPNRAEIEVNADAPGWLVLTDLWYPGWECALDDQATTMYRANFLFRAVRVPAGRHHVRFTFAPRSYTRGKLISGVAVAILVVLSLLAVLRRWGSYQKVPIAASPSPC